MIRHPPKSALFPYTPLFQSLDTPIKDLPKKAVEAILRGVDAPQDRRSEEHTSELQSQSNLVCRLLLEKKKSRLHPAQRLSGGLRLEGVRARRCLLHLRPQID